MNSTINSAALTDYAYRNNKIDTKFYMQKLYQFSNSKLYDLRK